MTRRPAGATAVLASALVVLTSKVGVDFTAEEAVTLVAAMTILVSWRTPLPKE